MSGILKVSLPKKWGTPESYPPKLPSHTEDVYVIVYQSIRKKFLVPNVDLTILEINTL